MSATIPPVKVKSNRSHAWVDSIGLKALPNLMIEPVIKSCEKN